MLLLFGLALILNVGTSSAATTTASASTIQTVSISHPVPKVVGVTPGNNTIVSKCQTIKVIFSENVTAGSGKVQLKNGNTIIATKCTYSGKILNITPSTALADGVRYNVIFNTNCVVDELGFGNSFYNSTFTVSPITLAQMKDGQQRAQNFFNTNQRLPNYVSYGSTQIPIAQFQKIIATQGLKLNTKITVSAQSKQSLASIMEGAAKFGYSHSAHTAAAMEAIGAGDCWAMSDYLYQKLTASGFTTRIIEYATAYSANHRSVQYEQNGAWINVPYKQYGVNMMFWNTQSTGAVIRCS